MCKDAKTMRLGEAVVMIIIIMYNKYYMNHRKYILKGRD
jgi:hypothetical protein